MSETKVRKERRETIPAETFIETFGIMARDGKSAKDIAEVLGRDVVYVNVRASQLRKEGVSLPKLAGRVGKKLDVAALNAKLAAIIGKANSEPVAEQVAEPVVENVSKRKRS